MSLLLQMLMLLLLFSFMFFIYNISTIMSLLLQTLLRVSNGGGGRGSNSNGGGGGFKDLEDALVVEILRRVPADELWCSCRRVCTRWKALISSSDFVEAHLQQSPSTFFVFNPQQHLDFFLPRDDDDYAAVTEMVSNGALVKRWRHQMRGQSVLPVTSCNGLVLFKSNSGFSDEFYVGNPITGELITGKHLGRDGTLCGFFYHPLRRVYKLLYYHWTGHTAASPIEYALLTLGGSNKWRSLHHLPYRVRDRAPSVIVDNTIYLLIADRYQPDSKTYQLSECRNSILGFSMDSEKFHTMPHPGSYHCRKREWHKRMELLEMEGRLTCWCLHGLEGQLWILELSDSENHNGQWTHIYNLDFKWDLNIFPFKDAYVHNYEIQLVHIRNMQVLLVWQGRGVFRYNLQAHTVTKVQLQGISGFHFSDGRLSLTSYTKSMVMLKNVFPAGFQVLSSPTPVTMEEVGR